MNAKICVHVCAETKLGIYILLVNVTYVSAVHCELLCSCQSIIYFRFIL